MDVGGRREPYLHLLAPAEASGILPLLLLLLLLLPYSADADC